MALTVILLVLIYPFECVSNNDHHYDDRPRVNLNEMLLSGVVVVALG